MTPNVPPSVVLYNVLGVATLKYCAKLPFPAEKLFIEY